jgi:ATP-dependent Clp protease adapter protein ClpS
MKQRNDIEWLRATIPVIDGLPQCRLILLKIDQQDKGYVTDSLRHDLPVTASNAWRLMTIAQHAGRSLLMTTHRELAEMYRDRLMSRGLSVELEPEAA